MEALSRGGGSGRAQVRSVSSGDPCMGARAEEDSELPEGQWWRGRLR